MQEYEEDVPLICADKLAFDTQKQAQAAATVALHQYGTHLTVYLCEHCGLWHLSSAHAT